MDSKKKTLIKVTTVPESLLAFHKGHGKLLNDYFNVVAISSDGKELNEFSERERIRTISVNMYRRISVFKDIYSVFRMYQVFKKEKPFIVHSMTPKAGLVAMMAAFLSGVPHRIHTFTGLIFPTESGFKRFLLINIDRLICSLATIVIPEGNGVRNDLQISKVTNKELRVIANGNFNGIDLEYFREDSISPENLIELKRKLEISDSDFIFSFAGRLVPDKGIEELVNAFYELSVENPLTKLILVGDFYSDLDPISEEVLEIIKKSAHIIHIPYQEDIRPYLAIADVFVFPSYREGFPNSVMEAGAMGLPCIVTDINGSNEIIENSINGLVINKKNEVELNEAMLYLMKNESIRKGMASRSRQLIEAKYDRKFVQMELLKLYLSL